MSRRVALFADTVARPMIADRWALMSKQETGLAASAHIFASLAEIERRFAVTLGERGEDKFGPFVRVLRVVESSAA